MQENKNWRILLIPFVIALSLAFVWFGLSLAQNIDANQIEITPTTLSLAENENSQVAIKLTNPTTQSITSLSLGWLPVAGLDGRILNSSPLTLAPNSDFAWKVVLTRTGDLPPTSSINFEVSMLVGESAKVLYKPLTIQPRITSSSQDFSNMVNISPVSISLAEGESQEIALQIKNTTTGVISGPELSWLTLQGVEINQVNDPRAILAPGEEFIWQLNLTRSGEIYSGTQVQFNIAFFLDKVPRTVVKALSINARSLPAASDVATVEVQTALTSIYEQRSGWIYLIVNNKTDDPITVDPIQAHGPYFVTISPILSETTIPGKSLLSLPVSITVASQVQPGDHLLLFEVPIRQEHFGEEQKYTLVASHKVTVGVFAESDVLQLLSVPAIYLLPGFLTMTTAGLFYKTFRKTVSPSGDRPEYPFKMNKEEFWVMSILISIGIAFIYPPLTNSFFGESRDFLIAYGLKDYAIIWIFGVIAGILLDILIWILDFIVKLLKLVWRKLVTWLESIFQKVKILIDRSKFPTTEDDGLKLLHKLNRQGLNMALWQVVLDDDQTYFLLQARNDVRAEHWIGSGIEFKLGDRISPEAEKMIDSILIPEGNPGELIKLLVNPEIEILPLAVPPFKIPSSRIKQYTGQFVCVSQA
jgi:hypothetical protein